MLSVASYDPEEQRLFEEWKSGKEIIVKMNLVKF